MRTYFLLLLALTISFSANAQITASGNTDETVTKYTDGSAQDPVFIYSDLNSGNLMANATNAPVTPSYAWYKYNGGVWNSLTENSTPELGLPLSEGGYRVEIKDAGLVTETQTCWVFVPVINSTSIDTTKTDCAFVRLTSTVDSKVLNYYDALNTPYNLEYDYNYNWQASTDVDLSTKNDANINAPAPVEPTTYRLELSAFNNTTSVSSNNDITVDGYAVKAEYVASVTDRGLENEIKEGEKYSAPVSVNFEDKSLGEITDREWTYKDAEGNIVSADQDVVNPNYIFTEFGTYTTELIVRNRTNAHECEDTFVGDPIEVIEMSVDVPNAFSPNGDGINDKFMVVYKSIRSFKMTIVNRWGRKVFESTYPGDSWDGRIGGKDASEGVYFYHIDAKGFNEGEHVKLHGPIHLIRGKQ